MDKLPEAMIQHIQSFMTGKEACQTTILSKSWCSAWLTRPHVDLDDLDFRSSEEFKELLLKTMQRYQDLDMKIKSFSGHALHVHRQLLTELVAKAMKLGATHLSLASCCNLPKEVLQSQTLIQLSLDCCFIRSGEVNLGRLKSLRLHRVKADPDVINGIFSSCSASLEKLTIFSLHSSLDKSHLRGFNNLNYLRLGNNQIHPGFFNNDFSSRFPGLKDLHLDNCRINKRRVKIWSPSVERVSLGGKTTVTAVELDFPRIRKLEYSGVGSTMQPCRVCSKGTSWESHIWIRLNRLCNSAGFLQNLEDFVRELRRSKIYLYLTVDPTFVFHDDNYFQSLSQLVENLTVHAGPFLGGLDRVCTRMDKFKVGSNLEGGQF